MKINYTLEKDDLIAFQYFHYSHQAKSKNTKIISFGILAVIFIIFLLGDFQKGVPYMVISGLVYGIFLVLYAIYLYFFFDKIVLKRLAKQMEKGNFQANLGKTQLEILGKEVKILGETIESKINLSQILNVYENEEYFFLYITTYSAYIIPKSKATGETETLFGFLKQKMNENLNK